MKLATNKRLNIYDLLKEDLLVFETVLDVGCGPLGDLIDFEYSLFKKLIGIDRFFEYSPVFYYRARKGISHKDAVNAFTSRFTILTKNIFEYSFEEESCSLIICNKVLHFFTDDEKINLINKLYAALHRNGLIYLKINHNRHPNNTDLNLIRIIGDNIVQNLNDESDIRYLIDPIKFTESIRQKFKLLEKYTGSDDRTITLVILK